MCSKKAVRLASCGRVTRINFGATSGFALLAMTLLPHLAHATSPSLVLWNKLGSESEILNSEYGPNLSFSNAGSWPDVVGNPDYVPGVFGGALTIGPGSYGELDREHTVVSATDQYLNADRGTISVWYKQNSEPVGFDHGVYRLFDGAYGLSSGIGLWVQSAFPGPGPPTLEFHTAFGGPDEGISYDISSLNSGTWIHVAGVWDRAGIDNTIDTIRLYIDGNVVASTTAADWGTSVGPEADIAGGNDANIAGQFALDNLKVYNVAVTDFSDRFTEGVPEPASACLTLFETVFLIALRTKRS